MGPTVSDVQSMVARTPPLGVQDEVERHGQRRWLRKTTQAHPMAHLLQPCPMSLQLQSHYPITSPLNLPALTEGLAGTPPVQIVTQLAARKCILPPNTDHFEVRLFSPRSRLEHSSDNILISVLGNLEQRTLMANCYCSRLLCLWQFVNVKH